MKFLMLLFFGLILLSCSSEIDGNATFLTEREQNELSYFYGQGENIFGEFKERVEDQSEEAQFRTRLKKQLIDAQSIDNEVWIAIEDLEEVKANIINEWTGESAEKLALSEFGGKGEAITIYDLSKADNSTTDDYSSNSENGKNLQAIMTIFRKNLTENLAASSSYKEKTFRFTDSGISDFKDFKELRKKTEALIEASNVAPDDKDVIINIYMNLSFSKDDWSKLLPEEASYLSLFNTICHLEKEILKSRQDAFSLVNSRVTSCGYGFDKVLPIAAGEDIVSAGDTITLDVTMAAFNSYAKPIVKCTNGKVVKSSVKNGMGRIKLIAPEKGEQKVIYKGTITTSNKAGVTKTVNWEKEIWVKE